MNSFTVIASHLKPSAKTMIDELRSRHCEERSDEAIQIGLEMSKYRNWIASRSLVLAVAMTTSRQINFSAGIFFAQIADNFNEAALPFLTTIIDL